MTVVSIVSSRFAPESVEEGIQALHDVLEQTRAFPGCLDAQVVHNVSDRGHVYVVQRWRSVEDDTAYRAWRKSDGATPEFRRLVALRLGSEAWVGEVLPEV